MHVELHNKSLRLSLHKIIFLSISLLEILQLFYTERLNMKKDNSWTIYDNRTLTNNLCSNQP